MIRLEEKNDVLPICPHCKSAIQKLLFQELETFLGKRNLYFCPNCHATLGVSHRKGFWMG